VWFGEPGLAADPLVTAGAGATATTSVPIGISMVDVWRMLPAALASAVRSIEDVARGRLTVTLGPWHEPAARQAGARRGSSIQGMVEATRIIRSLLAAEQVTAQGDVFRVQEATLERQPVSTPLLWGVMGPRLVELAAAHADGVCLNYAATPERVHDVVSSAKAAALSAGKDPEGLRFPAHVLTFVDDDEDAATERFRSLLETIPVLRQEAGLRDGAVSMEAARERAACGPPAVVAARVDDYLAAGATEVIICDLDDVMATVDAVLSTP
jgi:alkanesulfonate monooxygenase SsuD/methylene tetrahydromethanopterin reductase-like flavin-dependent oxidoreductase (luciferase family)